jgi:hypothetical protein
MRILVLDQSGILPWLVERSVMAPIEVRAVRSIEEAERIVREERPDAAIVSLPPASLPWRDFQHLCATQEPPVPVLYESTVHASILETGVDPSDGVALFLHTPAPRAQLQRALAELLATSSGLQH